MFGYLGVFLSVVVRFYLVLSIGCYQLFGASQFFAVPAQLFTAPTKCL